MGKKRKKIKVKSCFTPGVIVIIIVGFAIMLLGLVLQFHTIHDQNTWEKVDVTYQESNCRTKTVKERGQDGKVHNVKKWACDRTTLYTYKGQEYQLHEKEQPKLEFVESLLPTKRYVNPNDPKDLKDLGSAGILNILLIVFGAILGIGTIVGGIELNKKRAEQAEKGREKQLQINAEKKAKEAAEKAEKDAQALNDEPSQASDGDQSQASDGDQSQASDGDQSQASDGDD